MTENYAYNNLEVIFCDGVVQPIVAGMFLSKFRGLICTMVLVMSVQACANGPQLFQPWQPTPFRPNVTHIQHGESLALGQSSALRKKIVQAADKKSIERVQAQKKQRVDAVRTLAKKLEQVTEASLTHGGSLREAMIEAKIDKHQIDLVMKELKDAVPKMREAGKMANREFEKMDYEK